MHGDERVEAGPASAVDDDVLVIEVLEVAVVRRPCRPGEGAHWEGADGVPVAVPVDGSVPVVFPCELPVVVLEGADGVVGVVEVSGVVDVASVGGCPIGWDVVPVDVEVPVGVLEVVPVRVELLLAGALALTPPPAIGMEMPPLGCSLIFVGVVAVDDVGLDAAGVVDGVLGEVGALATDGGAGAMITAADLGAPKSLGDPSAAGADGRAGGGVAAGATTRA